MTALGERVYVAKLRRQAVLRKFTKEDWRSIGGTRADIIEKQILNAAVAYLEVVQDAIRFRRKAARHLAIRTDK